MCKKTERSRVQTGQTGEETGKGHEQRESVEGWAEINILKKRDIP